MTARDLDGGSACLAVIGFCLFFLGDWLVSARGWVAVAVDLDEWRRGVAHCVWQRFVDLFRAG